MSPTASAGFEPANLGTKGQHATSRPPKPLGRKVNVIYDFGPWKSKSACHWVSKGNGSVWIGFMSRRMCTGCQFVRKRQRTFGYLVRWGKSSSTVRLLASREGLSYAFMLYNIHSANIFVEEEYTNKRKTPVRIQAFKSVPF